jgi:alkylhydroperoxidase family enzyme
MCDAVHENCTLDDALYAKVSSVLSDEAIIEALMLAGNYRTVAYITESLRLPLEGFGRRFPAKKN